MSESTQVQLLRERYQLPSPVYIAGPMTGVADFNYPTFHAVEQWIRTAYRQMGYACEVLNPARHGVKPDWEWSDYMRSAIRDVTRAKAVWLLPGWRDSRGANLEYKIAKALGIECFEVHSIDLPQITISELQD